MTDAKIFLGSPINFRDICYIYPPKIKDMANLEKYGAYQKILTITPEEIYDALNAPKEYRDKMNLPSSNPG